jgi:tetratricopeptide (TPR) repeat protein
MDYLEGQSLGDLIAQEGFLPVDRALNIFVQVSNALADAHKRGVIHRDLKPSNIILIEQGEKKDVVQIVDFGIAKMLRQDDEEATALTQTGEVFGSPLYMSPEQCKGEKLDLRADIYSMGCLMYETLTGKAPLIGSNTLEVLYKHINEIPAAMSTKQHPVSAKLESIVFKSLAKLPADRYQTMDDLERDLVSFQKYQQWSFFSFLRHRAELARLKQLPKSRREVIATRCIVAALVAFSCAALYPFFAFWNTANDPITRESLELDDDRPPEVEERHEYDKKSWEIARAQAQSYLNGASADVSPAVIYGALLKQGRYHSGNGSFELALQAFQLAYEFSVHVNGYNAYPSLHALLEKASIEYNLSSWDAAAKSYERFNELVRGLKREDERNAFYEARRGNCYWNLGQFDRAKQAFDGAIRLWSKPIRSPARGDAFADNEVTKDDIYLYALTKTRLAKILQNELKEANTDKHSEDYEIEIKRSAQLYFSALPLWRSITGNNEKNLGITELQLAELIQNRPQLQLMRRASFGDNSQLMKQDAEPESLFERGVKSIERSCGTNHEYYAIALLRRADYAWKQHHYWQALQERYSACEVLSRFQSAKMTK